jgi:hypothetical protein
VDCTVVVGALVAVGNRVVVVVVGVVLGKAVRCSLEVDSLVGSRSSSLTSIKI